MRTPPQRVAALPSGSIGSVSPSSLQPAPLPSNLVFLSFQFSDARLTVLTLQSADTCTRCGLAAVWTLTRSTACCSGGSQSWPRTQPTISKKWGSASPNLNIHRQTPLDWRSRDDISPSAIISHYTTAMEPATKKPHSIHPRGKQNSPRI